MTENRQTPRTFQCREPLWDCFERMARELECSVDYLLNDAMKQYARQRGYTSNGAELTAAISATARPSTLGRAPLPPPVSGAPISFSQATTMPVPAGGGEGMAEAQAAAPPPPPPGAVLGVPDELLGDSSFSSAARSGTARASVPPAAAAPQQAPGGGRPRVNIYYMGERFPVSKDRFIIGRGRQSSDLTIKDPNVSRQHAMIEYLNGYYYMVDMGSTNGVEYAGQRVQRRVVNEGDTFRVCDHELRFSFH